MSLVVWDYDNLRLNLIQGFGMLLVGKKVPAPVLVAPSPVPNAPPCGMARTVPSGLTMNPLVTGVIAKPVPCWPIPRVLPCGISALVVPEGTTAIVVPEGVMAVLGCPKAVLG